MSYRSVVALALCLAATLAIGGPTVFAQRVSNNTYRKPLPRPMVPAKGRTSPAAYAEEELPAMEGKSRLAPSQPMPPGSMPSDPFSDDHGPMPAMPAHGPSSEYCDDYCCDGHCDAGCCGTCDSGCCGTCDSCEPGWSSGQCYVTADYLYVRSSFSDGVGFAETDTAGTVTDTNLTSLEFDYESSFRFGGGYRLCGCGDEIRFMFTRLESSAILEQDGGVGISAPFFGDVLLGEELVVLGDVEVNSYELEYAKTIPLGGGGCGCGAACGGACGCGGGGACPAWDIAWSGGFRAAEAEWNRAYAILDVNDQLDVSRATTMDFDGAGLKVGLEGRRYFFRSGWLSTYAKGDLSLLYGRMQLNTTIFEDGGTAPDQIDRVSTTNNQIIPVTELEAGLTGQVSCQCRMSAGYLLSAWHDLGFREEDPNFFVDDANILGFDGFFARLEYAY